MRTSSLGIPLLVISFFLISCKKLAGGWHPPTEPEIVRSFRVERQTKDCKLIPIENAKSCAAEKLIPDAEWVYFEMGKDGNSHFYNANWRRDINNPDFVIAYGLLITTTNTKKKGEDPEIIISTMRSKCDEEDEIEYIINGDGYSGEGTVDNKSKDDNDFYNQLRYMCDRTTK
jgi:hypothetical protein